MIFHSPFSFLMSAVFRSKIYNNIADIKPLSVTSHYIVAYIIPIDALLRFVIPSKCPQGHKSYTCCSTW